MNSRINKVPLFLASLLCSCNAFSNSSCEIYLTPENYLSYIKEDVSLDIAIKDVNSNLAILKTTSKQRGTKFKEGILEILFTLKFFCEEHGHIMKTGVYLSGEMGNDGKCTISFRPLDYKIEHLSEERVSCKIQISTQRRMKYQIDNKLISWSAIYEELDYEK
ncbi:MAG: hypothetical protein MJ238_01655 [Bacilli bacterium]|nr:hypothetical protein [Bacilli bacterium]